LHPQTRTTHPLADGLARDAQPLPGLVRGQLVDVAQQQGGPRARVQLIQGLAHADSPPLLLDPLLGLGRAFSPRQSEVRGQRGQGVQRLHAPARASPPAHQGLVDGDPMEPGRKARLSPE
jgi:hypothetical protein